MPDVNLPKMFNSCFVSPQKFFSQKSYWLAVVFIFFIVKSGTLSLNEGNEGL